MAVTTFPFSGLTFSDFRAAAQVQVSNAYWQRPGSDTFRTNLTLAHGCVQFTGSENAGLSFVDTPYGATVTERIAFHAWRIYRNETDHHDTPWTIGVRPTLGENIWATGLDSGETYFFEWMTLHPTDATNMTYAFERQREKEEAVGTQFGAFVEIDGLVLDVGATVNSFFFTEPIFRCMIYGDSVVSGTAELGAGRSSSPVKTAAMVVLVDALGPFLPPNPADIQTDRAGAQANWPYILVERYCRQHGRRPVYINHGQSGYWQGVMGPNTRSHWVNGTQFTGLVDQPAWPSIDPDLLDSDKFKKLAVASHTDLTDDVNYVFGAMPDPDLIIFAHMYNDCVQRCYELRATPSTEDFFDGATLKDNIAGASGLIPAIRTTWPTSKLLIVNATLLDNAAGNCSASSSVGLDMFEAFALDDPSYFGCLPGQTHHDDVAWLWLALGSGETGVITTSPNGLPKHPTFQEATRIANFIEPRLRRLVGNDGAGTLAARRAGIRTL